MGLAAIERQLEYEISIKLRLDWIIQFWQGKCNTSKCPISRLA